MPEYGVALDTETHQIQPGLLAPPLVCGSVALLNVDALTASEYANRLEQDAATTRPRLSAPRMVRRSRASS